MRRREFFQVIAGGAIAARPFAALAQQPERMRRIGVFVGYAESDPEAQSFLKAFVHELQVQGWTDGANLRIDVRWASADAGRIPALAKELVGLKPDVILCNSTPVTEVLVRATKTIPIVFTIVSDPVGAGFVASLARPGGNVTGQSTQGIDLAGKRLELLRELVPALHRLAILYDGSNPAPLLEMGEVQEAAQALRLEIVKVDIRQSEELDSAFATLNGRVDALYVCQSNLIVANRIRVNALALSTRLPTMHNFRSYVQAGGLISYGPSLADQFARAADLVNKILRGAEPADIPVEQPTKYELAINLKTAKSLRLDVPPALLARADEVIE